MLLRDEFVEYLKFIINSLQLEKLDEHWLATTETYNYFFWTFVLLLACKSLEHTYGITVLASYTCDTLRNLLHLLPVISFYISLSLILIVIRVTNFVLSDNFSSLTKQINFLFFWIFVVFTISLVKLLFNFSNDTLTRPCPLIFRYGVLFPFEPCIHR